MGCRTWQPPGGGGGGGGAAAAQQEEGSEGEVPSRAPQDEASEAPLPEAPPLAESKAGPAPGGSKEPAEAAEAFVPRDSIVRVEVAVEEQQSLGGRRPASGRYAFGPSRPRRVAQRKALDAIAAGKDPCSFEVLRLLLGPALIGAVPSSRTKKMDYSGATVTTRAGIGCDVGQLQRLEA